jgi:hypothetical protein
MAGRSRTRRTASRLTPQPAEDTSEENPGISADPPAATRSSSRLLTRRRGEPPPPAAVVCASRRSSSRRRKSDTTGTNTENSDGEEEKSQPKNDDSENDTADHGSVSEKDHEAPDQPKRVTRRRKRGRDKRKEPEEDSDGGSESDREAAPEDDELEINRRPPKLATGKWSVDDKKSSEENTIDKISDDGVSFGGNGKADDGNAEEVPDFDKKLSAASKSPNETRPGDVKAGNDIVDGCRGSNDDASMVKDRMEDDHDADTAHEGAGSELELASEKDMTFENSAPNATATKSVSSFDGGNVSLLFFADAMISMSGNTPNQAEASRIVIDNKGGKDLNDNKKLSGAVDVWSESSMLGGQSETERYRDLSSASEAQGGGTHPEDANVLRDIHSKPVPDTTPYDEMSSVGEDEINDSSRYRTRKGSFHPSVGNLDCRTTLAAEEARREEMSYIDDVDCPDGAEPTVPVKGDVGESDRSLFPLASPDSIGESFNTSLSGKEMPSNTRLEELLEEGIGLSAATPETNSSYSLEKKQCDRLSPFLNIERVKVMIFSLGRRVHRGIGYERLFSDYWSALSMFLEGGRSLSSAKEIVARFLRTKTLRRLHNRLIMGTCSAGGGCRFIISVYLPCQYNCRSTGTLPGTEDTASSSQDRRDSRKHEGSFTVRDGTKPSSSATR